MTSFALHHRVFVMVLAALAMLVGLMTFLTMSRREDPELRIRSAQVICQWPGAPAEKIDELVADVLEGAIQRVDEVDEIASTSRVGVSIIEVELDDRIIEFEQVWDELRNELRAVERDLPEGATTPVVNSNFGDVSALCLTMYQIPAPGDESGGVAAPYSERELEVYAELIEGELEAIDSVSSVTIYGLQEERIYIEVQNADWAKLGITPAQLQSALDDRNIVVSSGQIETTDGRFLLTATGELNSLAELETVIVGQNAAGEPVLLGDLAIDIRRTIDDPIDERVRYIDGSHRAPLAVLLGVEMKAGSNVVEMGEQVMESLADLRARRLPPDLEFATVNDLPRQVDNLVRNFVDNLWQAVLVVLLVAFAMMGWRPAVVMAAAVPLCMVTALGVVRFFGVELEQFSIASLIISLGMIVDNAIVVSDQTLNLLRSGESKLRAAIRGASDLALPILTSTLTTVAAFLPLLTIPGNSGEYMRSLPIVVSCTLIASYFVAMTVTPILCFWMLKPGEQKQTKEGLLLRSYGKVVRFCMRHKILTLGSAGAALAGVLLLMPLIGSQFFPGGERDQFFVHIRLPHGAALEQTARVAERIEDILLETAIEVDGDEEVLRLANAYTFVGSGGPRLMLTMSSEDPSSRYAMMVVNTTGPEHSASWVSELRERCGLIPGARIDVRKYVLGPPVQFPVEYRLSGPDTAVLRAMGDRMVSAMRAVTGILDPYHDWGNSTYQVEVRIDDRKAELAGLSNRDVAMSVNDLISGHTLTTYREGDHTVPVVLRMAAERRADLGALDELYVGGRGAKVPLDSVAEVEAGWQPAEVGRFNRTPALTVGSQVEEGFLANQVSAAVKPVLETLVAELPPGYELEELGEQKESSEGQADISRALMISMALILLVLVAQYNSLAKPLVVLAAVPLALIGALLGLFFTGWPLGFMPSLGIVSLAGVVINNAIILIDFIQTEVASGVELREAVARAGQVRMRPILLTTLTTVGGLFPLALFGGPMWAGMSYAMIFGLSLSTVLTLVVVPTIYVAFVEWFGMQVVGEES